MLEPEGVRCADEELRHRPGGQQRVPALGMTEPGQVDRHQMGMLGEPRPHLLEREQAFRPRAEQQSVIVVILALGEPDCQPVDDPELQQERCVQPDRQPVAPLSVVSPNLASASL
jgi:hypothetical protein